MKTKTGLTTEDTENTERATPETDYVWKDNLPVHQFLVSRRLERERNEARDMVESLTEQGLDLMDANRTLKRERNEAMADLEFRRELYKVQENHLELARRERDEAREKIEKLKIERDKALNKLQEVGK